jgi:BarA-like signal transduction histidine kinase
LYYANPVGKWHSADFQLDIKSEEPINDVHNRQVARVVSKLFDTGLIGLAKPYRQVLERNAHSAKNNISLIRPYTNFVHK